MRHTRHVRSFEHQAWDIFERDVRFTRELHRDENVRLPDGEIDHASPVECAVGRIDDGGRIVLRDVADGDFECRPSAAGGSRERELPRVHYVPPGFHARRRRRRRVSRRAHGYTTAPLCSWPIDLSMKTD